MHPARKVLDRLITAPNGCWEWPGYCNDGGYGIVRYLGRRRMRVHRLIYELFNGPISDDLSVCHHCDNRVCCNPTHMFLGTIWDNMRDRDMKGRVAHGDNHYKRRRMLAKT